MKWLKVLFYSIFMVWTMHPFILNAEMLAMVNYETKPEQISRTEGIAIIDVDMDSENFGKILMDIPLPYNLVNHHIYYNRDMSKVYVTALGLSTLHIIDMTRFPYRMKAVEIPECKVLEDATFTSDNKTWYLTCLGSQKILVGDAVTDKPVRTIALPEPYPHGITLNENIDRLMVTSTISPDGKQAGETITVIEASSGKVLSTHKVSNKSSPSGVAPVEVVFVPHSDPPMAYIDNLYGGTLWLAVWDPQKQDFNFQQTYDFGTIGSKIPLNLTFSEEGDTLYVTTGIPGHLNVFDISQDPANPKLVKSIKTAEGAHHVVFSPDKRYAFVQNNLLNLPGLSDGAISVVDLEKGERVASIDTFKNQGLNPNCIILLPEWSSGHSH
jgi:DNA-binding beta-propeller fold protein YncE